MLGVQGVETGVFGCIHEACPSQWHTVRGCEGEGARFGASFPLPPFLPRSGLVQQHHQGGVVTEC